MQREVAHGNQRSEVSQERADDGCYQFPVMPTQLLLPLLFLVAVHCWQGQVVSFEAYDIFCRQKCNPFSDRINSACPRLLRIAGFAPQEHLHMTKNDAGKPRGPGRPSKGKLKVTLRLSPRVVDALSRARERTGRDKSELAEEALVDYLHLGTAEPAKRKQ